MATTDEFLSYGKTVLGPGSINEQWLNKDYQEIKLAKEVGAVDWCVDYQENLNNKDGDNSPEIAGNDYSGAVVEYYINTQEDVRFKSVAELDIYLEWTGTQAKSADFAGITGGLTKGISFFWDRTFDFNGTPVVIRLFATTPAIKTTRDLYRFVGLRNIHSTTTTSPNVTSLSAHFTLRNPPLLKNIPKAGFVSDRFGVTLNDNFDSALTGALNTFEIRVSGDSLFLARSLI